MRGAQELLCALIVGGGGGCPTRDWWWRESKKSNKPSKLPGMYENGAKMAGLIHDIKIAENAVFYLKVLKKAYSRDVF